LMPGSLSDLSSNQLILKVIIFFYFKNNIIKIKMLNYKSDKLLELRLPGSQSPDWEPAE
jgi:hypothetical protein